MDKPTDDDVTNFNKELILGILAALAATEDEDADDTEWDDVPNGNHVRPLNETNFRETINENCCVLVFFHAKWCVACSAFKPVYAEFAANAPYDDCRVNDNETGCRCCAVIPAAVDCTNNFTVPMECAVDNLPAVMMFLGGNRVAQYAGDRSVGGLREFVRCTLAAAHGGRTRTRAARHGAGRKKKRNAKKPPPVRKK